MKKKKILILTANFGAGHTSVAKAVKKYIEEHNDSYEIKIQDSLDISVPYLNKVMVKFYEYQTKYTPWIYNVYYYTRKYVNSKYNRIFKIHLKKLNTYLKKENPDLVISTFPYASASVNCLKKHSKFNKPLITIITDVVDSYEWIHQNTDMYFVPSNHIKEKLIAKNVSPDSIKVTGVPVDKNFLNKDKRELNAKKKILLMGGGRGLFDMSDSFFYWLDNFIKEHQEKLEATIITGTNKNLFYKLDTKKPLKYINVLGFTTNMPTILKKHDILITKAGGATLFESINSGLPVIVKKPNIGQEIANAKFINKKNIGVVYSNEKELKKLIKDLVNDENKRNIDYMLDNIDDFKKEINPTNIYSYIEELF